MEMFATVFIGVSSNISSTLTCIGQNKVMFVISSVNTHYKGFCFEKDGNACQGIMKHVKNSPSKTNCKVGAVNPALNCTIYKYLFKSRIERGVFSAGEVQ